MKPLPFLILPRVVNLQTRRAISEPAVSLLVYAQIFRRVFVAMLAVRHGVLFGSSSGNTHSGGKSTYRVHLLRDRLQMCGVDAASDAAQVVKVQSRRYRPDKGFVRNPMGRFHALSGVDSGVSSTVALSQPEPTSRLGNRRGQIHQAICDRLVFSHASLLVKVPWSGLRSALTLLRPASILVQGGRT